MPQKGITALFHVINRVRANSTAGLTLPEIDDLTLLGEVHGLAVGIVDDVAYVGFSHALASWTVERALGQLWVARIADGAGRPCDGWQKAARSIEEAMTRIVADSETEGWDR